MELKDRERKIDISKLPIEQMDVLSQQIGDKVRLICDEAANKVNSILAIYGMSAKMAIVFNELSNLKIDKSKDKKKNGRKSKQDNLKVSNIASK